MTDWYTPVSSIPGVVAGVRAAVDSTPRDASWRRAQLRGVRAMVTENREALIAAIAADLGRPTQEIVLFELNTITDEVDEVRFARGNKARLARWRALGPPPATPRPSRRRWPTCRRGWRTRCSPCPRRSCRRTPS